MNKIRTYSELMSLRTYAERLEYLQLTGVPFDKTFGDLRYLNQDFYMKSSEWNHIRKYVIARDKGCDLAVVEIEIPKWDRIIVHHMNPIAPDDIISHSDWLLDPEYLITTTMRTHNAIHYGAIQDTAFTERFHNDTCPWRC